MSHQDLNVSVSVSVANPAAHFDTPAELLESSLSLEEKLDVLDTWEDAEVLLIKSSEKGVHDTASEALQAIHEAQAKIRDCMEHKKCADEVARDFGEMLCDQEDMHSEPVTPALSIFGVVL